MLQGSATYAPEKDALVWKIKNFPGGREFLLRCKFGLPSVAAEEEAQGRLPPIKVKFEIPYYSVRRVRRGAHFRGPRTPPTPAVWDMGGSVVPKLACCHLQPFVCRASTGVSDFCLTYRSPLFFIAICCSGIQIRYLKVIERSGYQALPWYVWGGIRRMALESRRQCHRQ